MGYCTTCGAERAPAHRFCVLCGADAGDRAAQGPPAVAKTDSQPSDADRPNVTRPRGVEAERQLQRAAPRRVIVMSLISAVTAGVLVSLALNSTPGATSSPAERPAGPAVAQTPPYEISETIDFADRADYRIDSDRVAELDEILRGAGSSDVITPCPLGDPGGMLAGLALESTPADAVAELYGLASDNRDASFQSDPEVSCLEAGLDVSYSRSDQPLTVDRALAWTSHRGFSSVSEPVPFFEGEAFTYCSEDGDSCGATCLTGRVSG